MLLKDDSLYAAISAQPIAGTSLCMCQFIGRLINQISSTYAGIIAKLLSVHGVFQDSRESKILKAAIQTRN